MAVETDLQAEAGTAGEEQAFNESPAADEPEEPRRTEAAGGEAVHGASGVLRDAIQKVMEEIEYHEREAKRHAQQARDLRRELRESFSYLLERGEKERLSAPPEALPGADEEVKQSAAAKRPRAEAKAKGAAKKGKKK